MKELIRYILKEETSLKHRVENLFKNIGLIGTLNIVGGFERFKKIMNIETPMDYLRLFEGMDSASLSEGEALEDEPIVYDFYRFKKGNNFMVTYNHWSSGEKRVILHWEIIWDVLQDNFGLTYSEANELLTRWVDDVYNFENFYVDTSAALTIDGWMSKEMV